MAVYCGVCASRISSACENGGSFPSDDFGGWDDLSRISDTCEACANVLRVAVSKAAQKLKKQHGTRVESLRAQNARERANQEAYEKHQQEALQAADAEWRRRKP